MPKRNFQKTPAESYLTQLPVAETFSDKTESGLVPYESVLDEASESEAEMLGDMTAS